MASLLDRNDFDIDDDLLWVMHCSEGLVPRPAAEAARRFLEKETRPWRVRWEEDFTGIPARLREEAASLLGAVPEDITLTATTSSGLITVAQGLSWREGDEVLLPLGEFPSNIWPWIALASRGVAVRQQPLWEGHRAGADAWRSTAPPPDADPEGALLDAIGPRTRVVSASWVRFQDGLRLDLARLARGCNERGVHLVVDGIQGAGTWPVAMERFAAFAAGGHKGLLAPQGLGILWTDPGFRRE
ncbi:MAG: aminotransferase class V-fold PLP-dependent enzyme, partial [Acidobacteriota bacterium]|nr:aminotransferase class V-fold PLP-dependent enzyme [Acidobacteriota bacterium]